MPGKPGPGTRDSQQPGLGEGWRPTATLDTLKARAALMASVRAFFASRGLLEVDTPILSRHGTVDRHIDSFAVGTSSPGAAVFPSPESRVASPGDTGVTSPGRPGGWLHTSPEFAMKRLLAAGSGPIWQIAHVFRREESGRHHNPEFAMLEWYRPGWDHHRLMDEVEALLRAVHAFAAPAFARLTYREAFQRHAGVDPHAAPLERLRALVSIGAVDEADAGSRDFWLDLAMSQRVGPALGREAPVFVHDFPASQAALARVRPGEPPLAQRFELFWQGLELANGFHELADADEQARRFAADRAARLAAGRDTPPHDAHLIAALRAGLPDCAGVALGLDRLLMLARGLPDVASAMAFAFDRA